MLVGNLKKYAQEFFSEKLPSQDHIITTDSEMKESYLQESKEEGTPLKCKLCVQIDVVYRLK